jgi:hypothetical protein
MSIMKIPDEEEFQAAIEKIVAYIKDVQFGTVTIYVQDSKIVQIDKLEKTRIK